MSDARGKAHAVNLKPKPRYADLVYELHRRQQLDSFLEILLPFAAEDEYVLSTHLYNSFVALCADTPMSYEQGDWYNDTQSAWEQYIWDVMAAKIKAYMDEADILSQGVNEWDIRFKVYLTNLHEFIQHYPHWTDQNEKVKNTARLNMAENFYRLVLHMFDVPHKVATDEHGMITAFCPKEGDWQLHPYKNERLRVHYQHDKKMMDFLKHAAWLFWCGDDIRLEDELTDKRITPMVKEYARLRSHVCLRTELHEPIYAALAREVLYPTALETLPDASTDTHEVGPASYDSPEDGSDPQLPLWKVDDIPLDALLPRTATQLTPKPASVRSMLHLLRADGA